MRLTKRKTQNPRQASGSRTPLAEGLRKKRPNGFFRNMDDKKLIKYAKEIIFERNIKTRTGLEKSDSGLYDALRQRCLMEHIGIEKTIRSLMSMKDHDLLSLARDLINNEGISKKVELQAADGSFYSVLAKKKLLDKLGLEELKKNWSAMGDQELVGYAEKLIDDKGLDSINDLQKEEPGLYDNLRKRRLLKNLSIKRKRNDWLSISDRELIRYAKKYVEDHHITKPSDLKKSNSALYQALRKRGLLGEIGISRAISSWKAMSDTKLVLYANTFIEENNIRNRTQFQSKNNALCLALRRRGLWDSIKLANKKSAHRRWHKMSDEELIEYAKKVIEKFGIKKRSGLEKKEDGLYRVLLRRNLLDRIFPESAKRSEAEILSQLKEAIDLYLRKED